MGIQRNIEDLGAPFKALFEAPGTLATSGIKGLIGSFRSGIATALNGAATAPFTLMKDLTLGAGKGVLKAAGNARVIPI